MWSHPQSEVRVAMGFGSAGRRKPGYRLPTPFALEGLPLCN